MTKIIEEIRISADQQSVWEILSDLGGIQDFHPGVTRSYYHDGARTGIGASRHCDLKPMGSIEETVVDWQEGESYVLEIHDGNKTPPFKKAFGSFSLRQEGGETVVSMKVEYSLKFGPIGAAMDALMVRSQFRKVVPSVLNGLKIFAESRTRAVA